MPLFICQRWKPSAGRMPLKRQSPRQEGHCRGDGRSRLPFLTQKPPCERGTAWGQGSRAVPAIQHAQARWRRSEVERPARGCPSPRGAGSASCCRRDGSCCVPSRGNGTSRDVNCLEKTTQERTSSLTLLPTAANARWQLSRASDRMGLSSSSFSCREGEGAGGRVLQGTLHLMAAAPGGITEASAGNRVWLGRFSDQFPLSNILKHLSATPIYLGSLNLGRELPQAHKSSQRSWLASHRDKEKHKPLIAGKKKD